MAVNEVLSHVDADFDNAIHRLQQLVRIPSISRDPAFADDCEIAAEWLTADLRNIGFEMTKSPPKNHPILIGHCDGDSQTRVLFCAHYDVRSPGPLALWHHPPFDPKIEDTPKGKIIRGRGTSDDKAQMMTFFEACRAWVAVHGSLPLGVTLFLDGNGEREASTLEQCVKDNAEKLKADIGLICDTPLYGDDTPSIITICRGLLNEELTITGPSKDLHSAFYGGIAQNPIHVLSNVITKLRDENGRVTIPGFYDDIIELPAETKKQWDALEFSSTDYLAKVGLSEPLGEPDRSGLEKIWYRPTCEINGITGGYQGRGFKSIIPSKAGAKISFRLVPGQDPDVIRSQFRNFVKTNLPKDFKVTFASHEVVPAALMTADNYMFGRAREALSEEWDKPAAMIGIGGSIPLMRFLQDSLGIDTLLVGFRKSDDKTHSANEKYDLDSFHRGIRCWVRILDQLSKPA